MLLKWMNADQTVLFVDEIDGEPSLSLEPGHPRWAEFSVMSGIEPFPAPSAQEVLAENKASQSAYVDRAIGEIRLIYITDIPGQSMTYQAKEAEAVAFTADTDDPKDMTKYPYIAGEAAALSETAANVAQTYSTLAAQWRTAGVQLEALRISTKAAIDAAVDLAGVEAAVTAFDAAIAALQP